MLMLGSRWAECQHRYYVFGCGVFNSYLLKMEKSLSESSEQAACN
jgi:hypothetical protein